MNSAANPETIADIVREMREGWPLAEPTAADLGIYADRIEAAAKRANDIAAALLAAKGVMSPHPDPDNAPPPTAGDAAAMREALEGVVKYLGEIIPTQREIELVKSARAALSAPARNCDRFATYKEAVEAYRAWAKRTTGNVSNVSGRGMLGWIFDTAEGKEESNG